jgi:hypothetical protein
MKLINIKKLEDCIDGSMIFMYSFNEKIDETLMKKLGEKGNLQYYPEFPRPFFKLITTDGVQVKGIIWDDNIEVVFPRTNKQERKTNFETNLVKMIEKLG